MIRPLYDPTSPIVSLLATTGRDNIYRLIKARFPDADPQEKVLDWTFDLANTRVMGVEPPNALGIDGFGDIDIAVLESMLNREEPDVITASLSSQGASVGNLDERMAAIYNSPILRPLLVD